MDFEMIKEEEKKSVSIWGIRKKFSEWKYLPYQYQMYNLDEGSIRDPNCPPLMLYDNTQFYLDQFYRACETYQSFDFSIEPDMVGEVKHCSYSELDKMTNFKNPALIQKTLTGRLFHGTIVEGSVTRPAIVKTWDYVLPMKAEHAPRLNRFCDEIELLTDERANTHPNLVKLYKYCFDTRLVVVYDAKFTGVLLSDVLLSDEFGWDDRMKVATQLADLFLWLHEKGIAVGSVTASCIMIDDEVNIKVFDFGYVSNHVNGYNTEIPAEVHVGWDAPEVWEGPYDLEWRAIDEAKRSKKYLVHECFEEIDYSYAFDITLLAFLCVNLLHPDKRPTMKDVVSDLKAIQTRVKKRKRDENEAE